MYIICRFTKTDYRTYTTSDEYLCILLVVSQRQTTEHIQHQMNIMYITCRFTKTDYRPYTTTDEYLCILFVVSQRQTTEHIQHQMNIYVYYLSFFPVKVDTVLG